MTVGLVIWHGMHGGSEGASQVALVVKNPLVNAGDLRDVGLIPGSGSRKILWRRKWQPPPIFFPGEPLGQRSLMGYTVHAVAKSQTRRKRLSPQVCRHVVRVRDKPNSYKKTKIIQLIQGFFSQLLGENILLIMLNSVISKY